MAETGLSIVYGCESLLSREQNSMRMGAEKKGYKWRVGIWPCKQINGSHIDKGQRAEANCLCWLLSDVGNCISL